MKKTSWLFAALSIAALTFGASAALAAENVKIGVLMPLTGNAAAAGQASKAAIEVAAEIVNNAHPELGNLPLATTAGLPHIWAGQNSTSSLSTIKAIHRSPSNWRRGSSPRTRSMR